VRVDVCIEEVTLEGDYGDIPGVRAICERCGHTTESFGQHDGSRTRCLVLLREECPNDENNFYEEE
jgi:hypothetical protein